MYAIERAMRVSYLILIAFLSPGGAAGGGEPASPERKLPVDYHRDVRPILSDRCYGCHGPDAASRKAGLRLDLEEGALADRKGSRAVVPGDTARSALVQRIRAEDERRRMPPRSSGKALSAAEASLLERWIAEGAPWGKHWAFVPPQRRVPPSPRLQSWARNPIDLFVLARLEESGLAPSPEAPRETLIRRASLDLTGLPPTPEEVDVFLSDRSEGAWERLLDRLLASPRYGERMAAVWIDAARYADTNGYQTDGPRTMWRWRDWVIDAYNRNLPFDRFTVEQLAGDLLPGAGLQERIATGFHRNHRGNAEGGIIPEEYAVEYVADRVETTAMVWLGVTLACARCHDHKYDPFTQEDFYRLFAFFNNVPERGKAIKYGNSPPFLKSPTPADEEKLADLEKELSRARHAVGEMEPEAARLQAEWERTGGMHAAKGPWPVAEGLLGHWPAPGENLDAGDVADFGFHDRFSLAARVLPAGEEATGGQEGGTILARKSTSPDSEAGYSLVLEKGRLQVNLVKRSLDDAIRVETEETLAPGRWHHLLAVYDGSRVAEGVRVYLDGRPARLRVLVDDLNQSFASKEPLRIGWAGLPGTRFRGSIEEVSIYRRALTDVEADRLAGRRTPEVLRAVFLETAAPGSLREAWQRIRELERSRAELLDALPTTMVLHEMDAPRPTHVLIRGQYDQRGKRVEAGVPAALSPFPRSAPRNRLGLARWIVDRENPLAGRVAANRLWQMVFGTGLVKTAEDFGSQGEPPSHPGLLDWLAVELVDSGWDQKALLRLILSSAVYRQTSRVSPSLLQLDPDNRLLGRGPRFRLDAGEIRDQALLAAGLLVERIGGPPVRPYQPPGIWKELAGGEDYVADRGEGLHRRSLYTYWKRTAPPPTMATLDASPRETACVRQSRTNTPLQALTLLNEPGFVEAARSLARRAMTEGGKQAGGPPENRVVERLFRLVLARKPRPEEREVLLEGLGHHLALCRKESGEGLDATAGPEAELAAWTALASLVLNLDEALTKE